MMAYHGRSQRWAVVVTHRGFGKTWGVVNDLIKRCILTTSQSPRFFYLAPYRIQAKAIAWDALKRFSDPIPNRVFNESDLYVSFPGDKRITLYGADNFEALRGLHFNGGVIDETEDIPRDAIDYVLDFALVQRRGWLTEIGTIKGGKGLYKKWDKARNDPDTFTMYLRASQSGVIPQAELERLEKKNPVAFAREMELDPNAEVSGSIYGRQMSSLRIAGRIKDFVADQNVPFFTFWDVGQSDFTAIWLLQLVGRDICAVDYYCMNGRPASHYADHVMGWEKKYGRPVSASYLPHDAEARVGGSGKSWRDLLLEAGLINTRIVSRTPDVWLGINELRTLLPRFYIHQGACGNGWVMDSTEMPSGIDCLDFYHSREQSTNGIIHDEPVHDQYSHGASALRTFAEAYRLGMIEGTSSTAKETRNRPIRVLRGPSGSSYPVGGFHKKPNVIRR